MAFNLKADPNYDTLTDSAIATVKASCKIYLGSKLHLGSKLNENRFKSLHDKYKKLKTDKHIDSSVRNIDGENAFNNINTGAIKLAALCHNFKKTPDEKLFAYFSTNTKSLITELMNSIKYINTEIATIKDGFDEEYQVRENYLIGQLGRAGGSKKTKKTRKIRKSKKSRKTARKY